MIEVPLGGVWAGVNRNADSSDISPEESPDCSNCAHYRSKLGLLGPRLGKTFVGSSYSDDVLGFFPGRLATGRRWIVGRTDGVIEDVAAALAAEPTLSYDLIGSNEGAVMTFSAEMTDSISHPTTTGSGVTVTPVGGFTPAANSVLVARLEAFSVTDDTGFIGVGGTVGSIQVQLTVDGNPGGYSTVESSGIIDTTGVDAMGYVLGGVNAGQVLNSIDFRVIATWNSGAASGGVEATLGTVYITD